MKSSKQNYYLYNQKLQPYADTLRKTLTKAEACMWKYVLRARRLKGYQFRRQRPVLNYIADFMCKELSLIIEVDGITHSWEEVSRDDAERQRILEQAGFTVLRFSDEEVLHAIDGVMEKLERWVEDYESKFTTPLTPPAGDNASNEGS